MKYNNLNKNRGILLAHDLITHHLSKNKTLCKKGDIKSSFFQLPTYHKVTGNYTYKSTTDSELNRLHFIDSIEIVSNIDLKPYRGVSYNSEDGHSAKISSKLQLILTFYLINKITGQLPYFIKAKKSVANFNLRAGMDVGVKCTLRTQALEQFYKSFNWIMLPVKGSKFFQTSHIEKDYSIRSLAFMQPLNGYIILKDAWFIYKTLYSNDTMSSATKSTGDEMKELMNISNKIKLEQEQIGAHLRFNINPKILNNHPEIKGFILNYYIIPGASPF